jgi:AhpD family alkylhydroperoxidase
MTKTLEMIAFLMFAVVASGGGSARAAGTPAEASRADIQKTVGFTPDFVRALPDAVVPGLWAAIKGFENNPKTALSNKDKELIALAVASQAGNRSTIYAYTRCARANGATQAEIGEAVAIAGLVRQMSTFFNGVQLDEAKFRGEIARLVDTLKKGGPPAANKAPRTPQEEVEQAFGFVPDFVKRLPPEAVAGVWTQMKDLDLNPKTALPGKTKSLISLAVAAQVPCRYCVVADSEFAKLQGATERELVEAVTMAGIARQFGALIDGLAVDEAAFRRDFDRMTPGADKGAAVARKAK